MPVPRFLVTAGNTREKIDRVRDWGNIFTGNTGYSIARALNALGEVDLLTSNAAHVAEVQSGAQPTRHAFKAAGFTDHAELKGALAALVATHRYHAIFMTAAVADYKPAGAYQVLQRTALGDTESWLVKSVQAGKVKSSFGEIAIVGQPTEKLVDLFRSKWNYRGLLFKFKLEVGIGRETLLEIGRASRLASGADYLVANTLEMVSGEGAGAYLISDSGERFIARAAMAEALAEVVRERMTAK